MSAAPAAVSRSLGSGLAPMGRRIWAIVIDFILVTILQDVIGIFFGTLHVTGGVTDPMVSGGASTYASTVTLDPGWLLLIWLAYFTILEGLFAATPGKALAGVRVATLEGRRPSWRAVLLRNLLRPIDAFPSVYLIGWIAARWSPLRQRLGDRVAGTIVIDRSALIAPLSDAGRRRGAAVVGGILAAVLAACLLFSYFGRTPIAADIALRQTTFYPPPKNQEDTVGAYHLGALSLNGSTATYPVRFTFNRSGASCAGTMTLRWYGFLESWQMAGMQYSCH